MLRIAKTLPYVDAERRVTSSQPGTRSDSLLILILMVSWVAGVVALATLNAFGYPTPSPCLFKHVTGLPCPTCGGTRALTSLLQLKPIRALGFNPLLTVAFIAAPVIFFARERRNSLVQAFQRSSVLVLSALAVVLVNWAYLVWRGV